MPWQLGRKDILDQSIKSDEHELLFPRNCEFKLIQEEIIDLPIIWKYPSYKNYNKSKTQKHQVYHIKMLNYPKKNNILNLENILKADVVEMNIGTKDIKVFMHKKNDKIEIKNK